MFGNDYTLDDKLQLAAYFLVGRQIQVQNLIEIEKFRRRVFGIPNSNSRKGSHLDL